MGEIGHRDMAGDITKLLAGFADTCFGIRGCDVEEDSTLDHDRGIGDTIESGADWKDRVQLDVHVLDGCEGDHCELGSGVRHCRFGGRPPRVVAGVSEPWEIEAK